jgi:hypothetical protein
MFDEVQGKLNFYACSYLVSRGVWYKSDRQYGHMFLIFILSVDLYITLHFEL